jgi:hypothetical protein
VTISAEKFQKQPIPRQLGALAANLARISSSARWSGELDVVLSLINESIQFIEWIAPSTAPEVASELIDLQVMLGLWRKCCAAAHDEAAQRTLFSFQAKKWSDQVIVWSGLLHERSERSET